MIKQVKRFINDNSLLSAESLIIVGLSGGADSVALLHILNRLGCHCRAFHCNFHLREEESVRDERFAVDFADSLGIPIEVAHFDTYSYAAAKKISIEMAARELRYEAFEAARARENAAAIAVAHHRDDSIETLLINLVRGSGLKGLTGIRPKNGFVIRPLLCVSKQEIMAYVKRQHLPFVIDSSNLENNFLRNKIRNQLIPLLETLNPGIRDTLTQTMEHLRRSQSIVNQAIVEALPTILEGNRISKAGLRKLPSPEAVLFELLSPYGFHPDVIKKIAANIDRQSGKVFYAPGYRLSSERSCFVISERADNLTASFSIGRDVSSITKPFDMSIEYQTAKSDFPIAKDRSTASFDSDKLHFPLTLRRWQPGDRFRPFGMKGFQKLSDYFNNQKFDRCDKESVWILCSGDDICWVVGHRIDDRFRITEKTKNCCILKVL
ncbi:MAG: tRNA lysidine(34) synthetase TilS [Dysgonamonadaceae bacterium]|jgi:tRNA(Ile)-lysidine synthase|nr:tRNA lysidine(34) synthetase TilS [Dysgonamonadaceae bacterium]